MTATPILNLPYIAPGQAQKHITHNEALIRLDAIVQLTAADRTRTSPPPGPAEGDRHIVAASPTGAWAGQAGRIALFAEGAWAFIAPLPGWRCYVLAEARELVFADGLWAPLSPEINPAPMVGVNTTADATNRLAVAAAATLFTHAGSGHQLKLNKSASTDTGSILFQTNWSGRAEFGLTGDDKFHVKTSLDGSAWAEALVITGSGQVGLGTPTPAHRLSVAGNVAPATDNAHTLGASGLRWASVWAANGTIQTSDSRDKQVERPLGSEALALLDAIDPVLFRWHEGGKELIELCREFSDSDGQFSNSDGQFSNIADSGEIQKISGASHCSQTPISVSSAYVSRPGQRAHAGFIAQDVKRALDAQGLDFGVWGIEDVGNPDSRQWLRPDQLIAVLWAATKQIRAEFEALKARRDW